MEQKEVWQVMHRTRNGTEKKGETGTAKPKVKRWCHVRQEVKLTVKIDHDTTAMRNYWDSMFLDLPFTISASSLPCSSIASWSFGCDCALRRRCSSSAE